MTDQDDLILMDFGPTDSKFWGERLRKKNFKPPEIVAVPEDPPAPEPGYYSGEDGKTYYSDGKVLREVGKA